MENSKIEDVIIIGSGPAGYTAAIYAARADLKPLMITGLQPGGQLTTTSDVENYPGYPKGIMGPEMMSDFQHQAERFGTRIEYTTVNKVDFDGEIKSIHTEDGKVFQSRTVIICTGATAKWLGLPSEQHFNGNGVSACAVCDGFFYRGKDVVVVGGGDTAAEEASYLAKLCNKVYLVVRRDTMRASIVMQHRVTNTPNIEILWNTETIEILGDVGVHSAKFRNIESGKEFIKEVQGFFVAIGHQPNTAIFNGILDMDETGYLITKSGSTYTNLEGIFAAGDVQDKTYRQAVTAAGSGCMAALDAERYLAGLHN